MDTRAFDEAYGRLNAEQKKAVDTIEGPVMVIAGPGTGKTQILTLRIARILRETDTQPENILALTFTESGAAAMRERLHTYIGSRAYRVPIRTFHGFAETLIRAYPDAYPQIIGGRPASELAKIQILETIVNGDGIKLLRPSGNPSYYVSPILKMIATMKQEYITPDRLAEIIEREEAELAAIERVHTKGAHKGKVRGEYATKEKNIARNRELLHIYRRYEALLLSEHLYDFDDMILHTVAALTSNEDMRLDLEETYQYVLADEHQDVNGSQNAILEALTSYHERPNIFVVGDEKQAIYRFQGASLENFLYFEDAFPHTSVIALTENYRSGQIILDAAHSLIAVDAGKLQKLRVPLTANTKDTGIVERRNFAHQAVEDAWVAESVVRAIEDGVPHEEIAIIVRTNREVEALTSLLRSKGISVSASADGDILAHPLTTTVCGLIEAAVAPGSEAALFTILHGPYWNINREDLVRVLAARSYAEPLASIIGDRERLRALNVEDVAAVSRVHDVLARARALLSSETPSEVLAFLVRESGLLAHVIATDPIDGGRVVRRLYDEVDAYAGGHTGATLASVKDMFATFRAYNLALNAPYITTDARAVRVMTAHKSKGLEFDLVFIPHLTDNVWGKGMSRKLFDIPLARHIDAGDLDAADDERRLLYVAMTRARKRVSLSSALVNSEGRELTPSRLFDDIGDECVALVPTDTESAAFDPLSVFNKKKEVSIDAALFAHILETRGLSATSLNNYLASPWTYIYRNALRIPEVQPEHMLYGTALHGVMERVTREHTKNGTLPPQSDIKRYLESALARLPLSTDAYTRRHEQGYAALLSYLAHVAPSFPRATREEFTLKVTMETGLPAFPSVTLTGKLDRLDLADDGSVLRVIDYKTGKPKTRNAIEGKTASEDGAYKRQLVFYALLLSLYGDARYVPREYVLSFIEPDAKGKIHEETFAVSEDEIKALKEEVIRVVDEIVSGRMLEAPCDERESAYCHLARFLRSD